MNNNEIINAVKCGMKIAAREIYYMDFSSGGKVSTEYFATVSIGKRLFSDKKFNIGDNKIIFEYDTRRFITATVPLIKKIQPNNMFTRSLIRSHANTNRGGRIDIAIIGNKNGVDYPICAIEVKGDNPTKKRLIDDIRRNLEYFKHTDTTGKSDLRIAFNCAFESFSSDSKIKKRFCITTTDRNNKIKIVKQKYRKYINEIANEIPKNIDVSIDVFSSSEILVDPYSSQDEYEALEDSIHLTLGVMIIFQQI
ncbi:TPA: hypothetical protein OOF53_003612 [Morganella morganii]|uniref:hypothetical protein n=1 Tax=Morganella morganii TaxID=582 RepID=UPI00229B1E34|nr:hypothetical protein [Morganella morganii]HCU1242359.1 hypothetical protein [Morganella morganii]